jgi:hypothetical protein
VIGFEGSTCWLLHATHSLVFVGVWHQRSSALLVNYGVRGGGGCVLHRRTFWKFQKKLWTRLCFVRKWLAMREQLKWLEEQKARVQFSEESGVLPDAKNTLRFCTAHPCPRRCFAWDKSDGAWGQRSLHFSELLCLQIRLAIEDSFWKLLQIQASACYYI